jgi:hypothetical protein
MPDTNVDSLARFSQGQRILAVAAEMRRGAHMIERNNPEQLRRCYERSLDLMDRLCSLPDRPHDLKEYRRWRELAAGMYVNQTPSRREHLLLEEALIQLHPESWNALHPRTSA